jgi:hypothetical protein
MHPVAEDQGARLMVRLIDDKGGEYLYDKLLLATGGSP